MLPLTVLLLDDDIGFIFALSQELAIRNIGAIPATAPEDASAMLSQFHLQPNLLVINCALPGACTFAGRIARLRPGVSVIGIVSAADDCRICADLLKARFRDPDDKVPGRIPCCADKIEVLLREQRRGTQTGGA